MSQSKLLVVDDDPNICELLRLHLEKEGYQVKTAADGFEGVSLFKSYDPDLVLLDIMMPRKDGWQVCREIREVSAKPIIMITAKNEAFDTVLGLELGADDFIVKPFDMKVLSARVKAVLRRSTAYSKTEDDEVVRFDQIEISLQKYELKLRGKAIDVPPKELELLYFLARNCNRVFTRDQLLDKVWGYDYLGDSRTMTCTSSVCAKNSTACPTSGHSKPSGASATSSRSFHKTVSDKKEPLRRLLLLLRKSLFAVFVQNATDPLRLIKQHADGLVVIQRINNVGNVLAHIHFRIPLAPEKFRCAVNQVGRENTGDEPLFIGGIHPFQPVTEQTEGREHEDALCALLFQLLRHINDGFTGRDHVINDDDILPFDRATEVFMGFNRVFAVHDDGIVTAFIEHTEVDAHHG